MLYMNRLNHGFKIFGIGKVGPKGQVVIPAEAREALGLNPGDSVVVAGSSEHNTIGIMGTEVFERHMKHVRRHFGIWDEYVDLKDQKQKSQKNQRSRRHD